MKKIRGYFDKKADFGFVVTSNGMQKEDFYVASKNTLGATNKDIVEIEVLKTKKGKNKEAKIIKIIQSKNDLEENDFDIIGIYSEKKEGFGYVDIEGTSKGYFVYNKNKNSALDGDKIGAKIKIYKGRKEAEIIKIIERKKRIILGVYESSNKGYGFVISRNNLFKNDIFIKDKNLNGAKGGDLVGVEIKSWDKKIQNE